MKFMSKVYLKVGCWCFAKLFSHSDIFCNNFDQCEGIAFTNDPEFSKYVAQYSIIVNLKEQLTQQTN